MSAEDFRINAYVRQVLSRLWVNLQTCRYGAVGEVVYFHGMFEKIRVPVRGEGDERWERDRPEHVAEDLQLIDMVEKQIRREPNVKDVVFRLDNLRKVRGQWASNDGTIKL